ncbi:Zinc finger A20 and AN1 domain-containing stress-associated protein 8 [Castilleja foliolosa]|uniref:Zinc finger A20 and AN1 domain-containing stress-associated protein 8 n=1 Tax=Castilleja foliolosa TaxID=1961234 RepID=A0ABD3CTD1_9LAMI
MGTWYQLLEPKWSKFIVLIRTKVVFQPRRVVNCMNDSRKLAQMESSKETDCRAPEGSILCINNCGFFGSAATMNMCSKCHRDMILEQQRAMLAASSIESIVNGKGPIISDTAVVEVRSLDLKPASPQPASDMKVSLDLEMKAKEGPNRCTTCRKRVGLTGFSCKCGNLFCSVHRYSEKHDCQFDYRAVGQSAIAKANPIVKAEKLDKI